MAPADGSGGNPLLAREIEHRLRVEGLKPAEVWAEVQARLRAGLWDPRLYAPGPPEDLAEDTPLEPGVFFVAPWEMACAAGLEARPFATFSEALELHDRLWARWSRFAQARRDLERSFAAEARRLERLQAALEEDLRSAQEAERFRFWGDLLVREKNVPRLEGDFALVVDRYGDGAEVRIPFERRLSPRENAEALFGRYRRARRAAPQIERRTREAQGRLEQVRALAGQASAARTLAEVRALEDRWKIAPRGGAQSRTLRASQGESGPQAQAREYRSTDGWTILVGRGALANERLTFGVGAPQDFWLHAAEVPGAHVLVRNPRRAPELPPRTLEEAAALAAWFSKARGAAAVDVHYTQRRHVRRPRGAPPGQVLLKRFRTLRVRPLPPASG